MMSVKNHQIPPTILVERAFGMSSDPEREEQRRLVRLSSVLGWRGGQYPGQAGPLLLLPGPHTLSHRHTQWTAGLFV